MVSITRVHNWSVYISVLLYPFSYGYTVPLRYTRSVYAESVLYIFIT